MSIEGWQTSNYKLIALDLDGTLLTDDKRISEESKLWIHKAVESGVTVIFSTGRGIQTTKALWDELGLKSPMVLLNGAEIWEAPGQIKERTLLPQDTVRRLYEVAVSRGEWFWGYSIESLTSGENWTSELFQQHWMKFGIGSRNAQVLADIQGELDGWGTLEITRSAPINLEIAVKGISKESGVRTVCDLLGIEMSQVMAIGDSDNDLRLLKAAGLGVAMANGEEHVKSAAGAITLSNNEDGVAAAIKKHIFHID